MLDYDGTPIPDSTIGASEVLPLSKVDLITLIKTIEKLDLLSLISRITLVDEVSTIGTINTVDAIVNIANLQSVDLIDRITLIDSITNIGGINTVANLGTLNLVNRIVLIDAITNIGTLNLLNTINLIKSISSIDNITTIKNMQIGEVFSNLLKNPDFETAELNPWFAVLGTPIVTNTQAYTGSYSCRLGNGNMIAQRVPYMKAKLIAISFMAKPTTANKTVRVIIGTEGGSETFDRQLASGWNACYIQGTYNYQMLWVEIQNLDDAGYIYVDTFIMKQTLSEVMQPVRTSLKVQSEREDLLTKSFDLTVGTTSLLSAVASQSHKVYGWDYQADTDGANEFSATIGGVACKFARRTTKGIHAMTLVHPIICDVNTALSFVSAGNTKLSLRYKTEA
jgi:hypothetical protein